MAFVKIVKNKSYFMRFQTKFKRRRQGKTDYFARKRLVLQDKNKYNTPKYRLIARITNTRVIAQVAFATIQGDKIFSAADSQELRKYGLTAGLANYASAYATGLLLGRRLLKKVQLDTIYDGNKSLGKDYNSSDDQKERRPFKVILDVGLAATKTGSKVFAVMKGICDAGVNVPHSNSRFPGAKSNEEQNKVLRTRILGGHIDAYLKKVKGTEKESLQFSKWNECLKKSGAASIQKLYTKIHQQIRKNPEYIKNKVKQNPKREHVKLRSKALTNEQRKANIRKRIEIRKKELEKQAKKAAKG